jgi:septal ring factor EnvC (AmiA/AmiB activator)
MRRLLLALAISLLLAPAVRGQDGPRGALAELDARIGESLAALERAEADRARAETERAGLVVAQQGAERQVRERTRALYRMRRTGALPISGGLPAMLTHLGHAARLERMLVRDVQAWSELSQRATALDEEIDRASRSAERERARSAALEGERRALELAEVEAVLGSERLSGVVDRAFGTGGRITLRETASNDPARSFEALEGTLLLPVASPSRVEDLERDGGAALGFRGAVGALVRASAAGRVAFSGRHSAYGRLVILDHGGSWFTVYGGMDSVRVAVGDELPAGGPLGGLGHDALLFQVRRGTRALAPRRWLGL